MSDEDRRAGGRFSNRTLLILAGALVVLVLAGVLVYLGAPTEHNQTPSKPFASLRPLGENQGAQAVTLELTIDSIDVTTGSAELRLTAVPGEAIPPGGAVLFSSLGANPAIVIRPQQLNSEVTAVVPFSEGHVVDYPFERYEVPIAFIVLSGTNTTFTDTGGRHPLPFEIQGTNDAAGVTVDATHSQEGTGQVNLALQIRRTFSTRGWVMAMMAIYWVLALGAAAIALAVILGLRGWETRLLAWLSALLFALISFRTAAPGSPPIGTFLDFYAVFEAVGIVSASLLSLMILYLARSRGWLRM